MFWSTLKSLKYIYADPAKCCYEIRPGQSLTINWGGILYSESKCECGDRILPCINPIEFKQGTYQFIVPYMLKSPLSSQSTELSCSELPIDAKSYPGVTGWQEGMGYCMYSNEVISNSFDVNYQGQAEITLTFYPMQ